MLIAQLHKCGAGTHFLLLSDQFPEHFYLPPNTSFLFSSWDSHPVPIPVVADAYLQKYW